ncbi:KGG domain-containing protein, partial [Acinetobacter baumannii]
MANTRYEDDNNSSGTSNRGFASMDPERVREIASKGGRAAHASGNAHEFTSEEAREAGRAAHASGNAHEFTSEEAREAGALSHKNDDRNGRGRSRYDDDEDDLKLP